MKKLLSLLLALVMLLSLSACGDKPDPNDDDNSAVNGNGDNDKINIGGNDFSGVEDSKTYAAISLLDGDTFTLSSNLMGIQILMYQRGDDVRVSMSGYEEIVIDGKSYSINEAAKKATYTPATKEQIEDLKSTASTIGVMVILDGAKLTGTGNAEFRTGKYKGEGEFPYEEITEADGTVKRAFFDDDTLIGFEMENSDGDMMYLEFSVSPHIPEGVLEIPQDYEQVQGEAE